jgi:hypothetical protein
MPLTFMFLPVADERVPPAAPGLDLAWTEHRRSTLSDESMAQVGPNGATGRYFDVSHHSPG